MTGPSVAWLQASLALWLRRHAYRQRKLDIAHEQNDAAGIAKWHALLVQAGEMIRKRRAQIAEKTGKPRLITAAQLGLSFQNVFGAKGNVYRGTGHYTAGARCPGAERLMAEARSDHAYHKSKGWGGLSYEAMIADDGTIVLGNPMYRKGAAVASQNTGMVNICCPGTTGDRISAGQKRSIQWLLDNWHTSAVPAAHRCPKPPRTLTWHGHKEWPLQSTACPGNMLPDYHEVLP
jgi:N-acetylmuramoyl-L-alanine amidase-like protein